MGSTSMLENSLKTKSDIPGAEGKEALEKQAHYADRYANAMRLLFE